MAYSPVRIYILRVTIVILSGKIAKFRRFCKENRENVYENLRILSSRAVGSVVEHLVHTEGVRGSNPLSPTKIKIYV